MRSAGREKFLEAVEPMLGSSLITLEKVQLLRYGAAHCAGEAPEARSDVGG